MATVGAAVIVVVSLLLALPASAKAPVGDRTNPYPMKIAGVIGHGAWKVKVLNVNRDAWKRIYAENDHNKPARKGSVFVLVRVAVTKLKDVTDANELMTDDFGVVGRSNVGYDSAGSGYCGVFPDQLDTSEAFVGGRVEGNLCWQVKSKDVASLLLYWHDWRSQRTVFFATK